jgi:transposase
LATRQGLGHQPRPCVRAKKRARDRLIRWAHAHPDWLPGCEDEVWWSRLAPPALHAWADGDRPLRLVEQPVAKDDPDKEALACYGVLFPATNEVWLRFLDGRPVSAVTTVFLDWCCREAAARGKTALLLVWDNASWHVSKAVRGWIRAHNRRVKATGEGGRLIVCPLPIKSPRLNPIEPKWVHTKRKVVEPARRLPARELAERVCDALGCAYHEHIPIPAKVA